MKLYVALVLRGFIMFILHVLVLVVVLKVLFFMLLL